MKDWGEHMWREIGKDSPCTGLGKRYKELEKNLSKTPK
jgi:hypothetical protein